jgi:hypothetical protein
MRFNANNGEHTIESDMPLTPLDVTLIEGDRTIELKGETLTVRDSFDTLQQLDELIFGSYVALPALLNVRFADPPWVWRVDGRIGDKDFGWELADWDARYRPTTQDEQEDAAVSAWQRMRDYINATGGF